MTDDGDHVFDAYARAVAGLSNASTLNSDQRRRAQAGLAILAQHGRLVPPKQRLQPSGAGRVAVELSGEWGRL